MGPKHLMRRCLTRGAERLEISRGIDVRSEGSFYGSKGKMENQEVLKDVINWSVRCDKGVSNSDPG